MIIYYYIISSIIAVVLGQLAGHLNKKLPPVVSEEITYKEFFKSLKNDFKVDLLFSIIFLIVFNLLVYFNSFSITTLLYFITIFALSLAFSIDFKYQLIPDEVDIVIGICGIINLVLNVSNWWNYLLGAVIGGAIFYFLNLIALLILKKEGMGLGDVKLMAALGFLFGVKNILVITLVSFFIGAIIGIIVMIIKRKEKEEYIAFGPFIVISTVILMFTGADIIIEIFISFCSSLGFMITDFIYWLVEKFN